MTRGSKALKFLLAALVSLALLASCADTELSTRTPEVGTLAKRKKIVEEPRSTMSPCTALYSSSGAQATTSNAVIDPAIKYGEVGTLILSFNTDDVLESAAGFVANTLGIQRGEGLGVFENLPMLALKAPLTQELVSTLKTNLQGYGLLSIYQDKLLQYFLNESADFIGAPAARETFEVTGKGVGVAVLDSGVDGTQGDFANMVQNVKIIAPLVL